MPDKKESKNINFLNELKALLVKYNADIYAEMDGDTHGVSQEIIINIDNKEAFKFSEAEITHYDL